jgi:hypothetical protein
MGYCFRVGSKMTVAASDLEDIPGFLKRPQPLIFSYTMLHTYENICPHQAYRRYVKRDIPYASTPAMDYGNRVHEAFELRIGTGKPLPIDFQIWEPFAVPFDGLKAKTELKVAIDRKGYPADYWGKGNANPFIRGKIDTVASKEVSAYIVDWKTGNSKYEDPYELEIGAMMFRAKYPEIVNIKGAYAWLKENRLSKVYDLSDVKGTWDKTHAIVKKIEDDRATGQFEKRKSGLCGWCPCDDCEHHYVVVKK